MAFLVAIVAIVFSGIFAGWFSSVAKEKGFYSDKYFWICFFFNIVGYLLVVALPDRGNNRQQMSDELPEL